MRIVFRTDSSISMGSGHLMRCLTLANELRGYGAEIMFVSRKHPGNLIYRLEEAAYSVYYLPEPPELQANYSDDYAEWLGVTQEKDARETLAALNGQHYDWLVVDHYGLDITWEMVVRSAVNKILVIDDLANRSHDCDIILDQNYFGATTQGRYKSLVPNFCKGLFGPRYALIHSNYATMRNFLLPRDGQIRRVLVFFGASDQENQTAKLLVALTHPNLSHLVVDVVIGANHSDPEGIAKIVSKRAGTNLHQNLRSLVGLMVRVDLFIGAGGTTTWERMSLGLPSLVISIAENQQAFTHILTTDGLQFTLSSGKMALSSEWHEAINQLIKKPMLVKQVAQKVQKLVDGQGANRLARVMYGSHILDINLRNAEDIDEGLLLEWVNDDDVRKQSFCQEYVHANEHARWFANKLSDPNCIILIGEDEKGFPVGQVRFDIDRKRAEALIGISIDPYLRGMGLATKLLHKALEKWMLIEPNIKLVAEVRDENLASQQLFTKLRFIQASSRRKGSKVFELVD